jgi:hypothetical protein
MARIAELADRTLWVPDDTPDAVIRRVAREQTQARQSAKPNTPEVMDVRMPDGTIVTNVPKGTTQDELLQAYRRPAEGQTPSIHEGFGQNMLAGVGQALKSRQEFSSAQSTSGADGRTTRRWPAG